MNPRSFNALQHIFRIFLLGPRVRVSVKPKFLTESLFQQNIINVITKKYIAYEYYGDRKS